MARRPIVSLLFFLSYLTTFSQNFESRWNTALTGSSAGNQVTIPTHPGHSYDYTVDWGDGTSDSNVSGDITHTYAAPGTYTIGIGGTFPAIYFNNAGDRQKIIEILAWGTISWQTMENAFYGCSNLNFDAIDSPDLGAVNSLKNMFRDATSFNGILNQWDIGAVTDISGMLMNANIFNRPLDNWNTIGVTDMSDTFNGAQQFNEPLDSWNTASVTTMERMFRNAGRFNQNINTWDVSQVTLMGEMFRNTNQFDRPLNSWNVANVTDMSLMFYGSHFNQPLEQWNVGQVTTMSGMFSEYSDFNQNINTWDVSSVTDMSNMFMRARYFNQPLDQWDVSSVTDMSGMFDGFVISMAFDQPLNTWDVSQVTNMAQMFRDCVVFDQNLDTWDVGQVTDMSRMFENAEAFGQDLSGWDVGNVTDMGYMFQETEAFNSALNSWDVSSVKNMAHMFSQASLFDMPLDNWNTGSVIDFDHMFANAVFNQDISGWNVALAQGMASMFSGATNFDQNLASWNIENVFDMAQMLSNSGLSQENYDLLLTGWASQTVRTGVTLGANNLQYCDAILQRQSLIDDHGWTITGDNVNCPYVLCTQITMPHSGDTATPANSDIRWNPAPNATGYYVSIRRENGGTVQTIYNNEDVGNVVGLDFTNEFTAGDTVYVTVVPYNDDGPAVGCQEISFTVVESWANSPEAFKLTYDTTIQETGQSTPINQLRIQTRSGLTYDYSIDWGDGQYDNNVTGEITHTYLTPGIYTVSIIGTFPAPRHAEFNSDSIKLLSIDQWGTQVWQSMQSAFAGCENMVYNATDVPNLSNVTDMGSMFIVCYNFNGNINNWDVGNVTNMYGMFGVASSFNQSLDNWDVSNVTSMNFMFARAEAFNQDINSWNTGSVTDMGRMFSGATTFNQPLDGWDVSQVTDMSQMFSNTDTFNRPIGSWNVGNVVDMEQMFYNAVAFNQNINGWDVSSVTTMAQMFQSATDFDQPLNSWNVSSVGDMSSMFYNADAFDRTLDNWNVQSVTNMASMFYSADVFDQNIDSWNVTNVITMQSMFNSALSFNQPLNNWDVDSVVNMAQMFRNAQQFDQPLDQWDVSAVANMSSMFEDAVVFDRPINVWNVSSVTLMESMFEGAEVFNQELNNWAVASVTNFEAMFKDALLFDRPLGSWDTGEALTMAEMFYGASVFNQNLDSWDVSFVTTMASMFRNASAYDRSMDQWNVASVTTMEYMFQNASNFNGALGSWNVRGVANMRHMFEGASRFDQNINTWRVFNVTDMDYMFRNATAYDQPMEQWDLELVSMAYMFDGALTFDRYLGDWDVSRVSNMQGMLNGTALSRTNYDNTLIAWSDQSLTPGIVLGANGLPYCDALEERQSMIDTFGWNISGDILDCPVPQCTTLASPLNGASDVPVNTNLSWEPTLFARGYHLTVVVMPGNITVVNNETVNDTFYEFATDFSGGEVVNVTLTPFNDEGDAPGCMMESFTISNDTAPQLPDCTFLSNPIAGSTDVEVDTPLEWTPISNADGYRLTVGTTSGSNDIVDNLDLGNVTHYEIPGNMPEDTTIYVSLTAYNAEGDALGCSEESFSTEVIPTPPGCTTLTSPADGTINVPVDTDISWAPVLGATGYLVVVGTTQGGIEEVNNVDVGNLTTYSFPQDLQPNRTFYVTIIPYNDVGDAVSCNEESFRTGASTLADPPSCTSLSLPLNGTADVALDTDISWNATANTDGYYLALGTSSGADDILSSTDVGNVTTYTPLSGLPENTVIHVTIVPYNANGDAVGCTGESFTTETLATVPQCTELTTPLHQAIDVAVDTQISWNASATASGYYLTMGSVPGGNDLLNAMDVGNVITYDPINDLPTSSTIYVQVIPYNTQGSALGCAENSFTTVQDGTVLPCANLISPADGATNVALDASLNWSPVADALGYRITIGSINGGGEIADQLDVGNSTSFNFGPGWSENVTYYVTVVPYDASREATGCSEESFTTIAPQEVPECPVVLGPTAGELNVAHGTPIIWQASAGAEGYLVSLGTSPGQYDIVETLDVGNVTHYLPLHELPVGTEIFLQVEAYNQAGRSDICGETVFFTAPLPTPPNCTELLLPTDGAIAVPLDTGFEWSAVENADGYYLSLGTDFGVNDILDGLDVGLLTSYQLDRPLPIGTTVYATVTPYNSVGEALDCNSSSFTTIEDPELETLFGFSPDGDGINDYWEIKGIEAYPNNNVTIFNRWGDMVFQIDGYDNAGNVFRGEANQRTKMGAGQLPEGTYFFQIHIPGEHHLMRTKGFVVLKR